MAKKLYWWNREQKKDGGDVLDVLEKRRKRRCESLSVSFVLLARHRILSFFF